MTDLMNNTRGVCRLNQYRKTSLFWKTNRQCFAGIIRNPRLQVLSACRNVRVGVAGLQDEYCRGNRCAIGSIQTGFDDA